ncbi:MAG: hypothetical protein IJU56_04945 [Clostridia bacterium]|nr:hypothetical protein [Clostridia bacterium]
MFAHGFAVRPRRRAGQCAALPAWSAVLRSMCHVQRTWQLAAGTQPFLPNGKKGCPAGQPEC